jgi:hypothetical protein
MRECGKILRSQAGHRRQYGAQAISPWMPKTTNTHSQYVILISSSLQQWLLERRASILPYTYIDCLLCTSEVKEMLLSYI